MTERETQARRAARQLALFNGPSMWDRAHRTAVWNDIVRGLPANLGIELTREHGWRIIVVPLATRRVLQQLDAAEDPLPVDERRDAAVRRGQAEDMLAQAQAVLRAMQTDIEAGAA